MKNSFFNFLSFFSGALLVFAFAPFNLWWLGFICPALFLICLLPSHVTARQGLTRGCLFGLGKFGVGTSWIYISIHSFGNATWWLAGLITALFIGLMASYTGLLGLIFNSLFRRKTAFARCCFIFPSLWMGSEWCHCYLFTGFPWLALGYSQSSSIFSSLAPYVSVFGVSLITACLGGGLVFLFTRGAWFKKIMVLLLYGAMTYGVFHLTHTQKPLTHTDNKAIKIAMIQGNISQGVKWDSEEISNTINTYLNLTAPYWGYDLIIWPEASIPLLKSQARELLHELDEKAKDSQSSLLVGVPIDKTIDKTNHIYNGILALGKSNGEYLKRHPVPFGEYIPLKAIFARAMAYFDIPMSDLSKGPSTQAPIRFEQKPIATFICYEVAYPNEVLSQSHNSQFFVTINDDSWFGDSLAQPQQIQMAQWRSLETGRPMLYVSNTGITAIIDRDGKIITSAPENIPTVLTGTITPVFGNTPFMQWGFYPVILLSSVLFVFGLMSRRLR